MLFHGPSPEKLHDVHAKLWIPPDAALMYTGEGLVSLESLNGVNAFAIVSRDGNPEDGIGTLGLVGNPFNDRQRAIDVSLPYSYLFFPKSSRRGAETLVRVDSSSSLYDANKHEARYALNGLLNVLRIQRYQERKAQVALRVANELQKFSW